MTVGSQLDSFLPDHLVIGPKAAEKKTTSTERPESWSRSWSTTPPGPEVKRRRRNRQADRGRRFDRHRLGKPNRRPARSKHDGGGSGQYFVATCLVSAVDCQNAAARRPQAYGCRLHHRSSRRTTARLRRPSTWKPKVVDAQNDWGRGCRSASPRALVGRTKLTLLTRGGEYQTASASFMARQLVSSPLEFAVLISGKDHLRSDGP